MQKHFIVGACLVALATAAGCAAPEASDEPIHMRPDTTTGSNIPRRAPRAEAPAPQGTPSPASGTVR